MGAPNMCPICWATLLAAFSTSIEVSAAIMTWRDRWTLLLAAGLLTLAGVHQFGVALVPWRGFAVAMAALIVRIAWVALRQRDKLSVFAAWRRATAFAAVRCPNEPRALRLSRHSECDTGSPRTQQPNAVTAVVAPRSEC